MLNRLLSTAKRLYGTGVFWMGVITVLRAAGFVLVLPFVLRQLPAEEVGLWYVFAGIACLCSIVELGFAPNIGRFTMYYLSGLQDLPSLNAVTGQNCGNEKINQAGLNGLIAMSVRLYTQVAVAVLVLMIFGGGGWLFCKYRDAMDHSYNWPVYLLYAVGTAWSLSNYFWSVMLPASNHIVESQKIMLTAIVLNYLATLIGVYLGFGVLGLAMGQTVMSGYQRLRSRELFERFYPLDKKVEALPIQWKHLWPMTWRGGLMGLGMYLSLPATTLICAQIFDLTTTASYAISLQLVFMAYSLANNWLVVKYPIISVFYVKGEYAAIRRLVYERIVLQMISYVVICVFTWKLAPLLLWMLKTKTTFIDSHLLLLLMISVGVDLFVHALSAVVQCGNKFPFIYSKLVNGTLTVVLACILGKWLGLAGFVCAPTLAQITFNGWYITWWYYRDSRRAPASSIN